MTVLGKILAILNLVFSLFVGWLIIVTYVTRTNWHAAYQGIEKQVQVAQQDATTYHQEADEIRGRYKTLDNQNKELAEKMKANEEACNVRVQNVTKQLEAVTTESKVSGGSATAVTEELNRRQREADYYKGQYAGLQEKIKNQEKKVEDMRATAVEAQLAANSERERNNSLLDQNEKLTKELQKAQQNVGSALAGSSGPRKNPPAEDVEGVVKSTDSQSGYITISIGSDAGIHKGNTLEVYRLKPEPAYLGSIEILAVHTNEAVGKPISRLRGQIQIGDRVSSTIVSRR
ncbi:MAG TPA: hypothetical protein VK395_19535 [Gemmataceae bacterium]|nr:hypothetical protein [Gemmataceae bacterium]